MNILIIGGTGNISTEVAATLHDQGHSITVVTTGSRPVPARYTHIKANRDNSDEFLNALFGCKADVAIDFFAFIPDHLKSDYIALKGKISQFIFISSATVYEKPHKKIPVTEETPRNNPFWPYARDKIACEEYLESVQGPDFPVTIVRPSHTFGKTWIPSPINGSDFTIANRIINGKPIIIHDRGESLWTLTAATDFAEGFAGLVGNPKAYGEAVHITSDEALTWNKIYEILGDTLGSKPVIEYIPSDELAKIYPEALGMLMGDKKEHGVFDNSKIKQLTPGFQCRKSFSLAIRESVGWFMDDPSRRVVDGKQDLFIDSLIGRWKSSRSA